MNIVTYVKNLLGDHLALTFGIVCVVLCWLCVCMCVCVCCVVLCCVGCVCVCVCDMRAMYQ